MLRRITAFCWHDPTWGGGDGCQCLPDTAGRFGTSTIFASKNNNDACKILINGWRRPHLRLRIGASTYFRLRDSNDSIVLKWYEPESQSTDILPREDDIVRIWSASLYMRLSGCCAIKNFVELCAVLLRQEKIIAEPVYAVRWDVGEWSPPMSISECIPLSRWYRIKE